MYRQGIQPNAPCSSRPSRQACVRQEPSFTSGVGVLYRARVIVLGKWPNVPGAEKCRTGYRWSSRWEISGCIRYDTLQIF
jgi:hypothetical protein